MKKLLSSVLTIGLLTTSLLSMGQITITQEESRAQVIAVDPLNRCGVATNESGFFLFSSTSNMFDDAFILYLGPDKNGAKQTLESLIGLVEVVKTKHVTFQDFKGAGFTASMIYKGLALASTEYAGEVYVPSSLLSWLLGQLDNPDGGPWNSIKDAANFIGTPEKVGSGALGGQLQKWGSAYYLNYEPNKVYLGNSKEDALATIMEYEAFSSSKEQVWPVILLNARVTAGVTNDIEFGAKTSYVKPSDGSNTFPMYQLYLKRFIKLLDK